MGCDYNIIVHLEKFSHIALKIASFNCKFRRNSTEVAKWVIVILCRPRAKISCVPKTTITQLPHCRLGKTPKCAG